MPQIGQLLKSSVLLTLGKVLTYGLSFLRNVILARLLAKADFGLAAVFGMTMMLLELNGRMAFGTQVIQAKEGGTPGFQASAHALQFVGGLCSAALIAVMSVPMARLFDVPDATWAFASLALVPLMQGLSHLDIARRQRELDFLPLIMVDVVPQLLITAAAWPLAVWLGDYRVIVWLMIGKAVLGMLLSFGFARWTYRWGWEQAHIHSMLKFGWPLLLTGLVMFASQQADQMLVGAVFSLNVLANYALAASLVSIPWFVFGQVLSSLMLPIMSRAQDNPVQLHQQYQACAEVAAVGGVLCLLPLVVAGEQIVVLFYGAKYLDSGAFMALLGAAAIIRFLRFAPAVAALAKADTINQLYSNIWRASSLVLALACWMAGGSPLLIAASAVVGELLAVLVSIIRLQRRQGIPLRASLHAGIYTAVMVSAGLAVALLGASRLGILAAAGLAVGAFAIALATAWFTFPQVARFMMESFQRIAGRVSLPTDSA